jgi:hypothetical protein
MSYGIRQIPVSTTVSDAVLSWFFDACSGAVALAGNTTRAFFGVFFL